MYASAALPWSTEGKGACIPELADVMCDDSSSSWSLPDGRVLGDNTLLCAAWYGDVAPTTRTERIVAMCIMAIGGHPIPATDLRHHLRMPDEQ